MDQPNWKLILPAAAAGGFALVGFWGLLAGPLAASAFFLERQRQSDAAEGGNDEERRLAAFMAEHAKAELAKVAALREAPVATAAPAAPAARRASFTELKQRVAGLDPATQFDALARARLALLEDPGDAQAAAEAALLARRVAAEARHAPLRLHSAARAIATALRNAQGPLAAQVFAEYVAERAALPLEPVQWEGLGRALLGQGAFMEAAWALHAAALLAGDPAGAQKRLVETATKAAGAGRPRAALRLYRTLLEKYPDSQYAEFVRAGMREQEKKAGKG